MRESTFRIRRSVHAQCNMFLCKVGRVHIYHMFSTNKQYIENQALYVLTSAHITGNE